MLICVSVLLNMLVFVVAVLQMSPASGLVSILKKRSVCLDNVSVSSSSEPQPDKPTAKRRVRFKVHDDDEQGVYVYCLQFRDTHLSVEPVKYLSINRLIHFDIVQIAHEF